MHPRRCLPLFLCAPQRCAAVVATLWLLSGAAHAHTLGQGYLVLNASPQAITGHVEMTLTDLDVALGLDTDKDGKVSDAELLPAMDRVFAYLAERIDVGSTAHWYGLMFDSYEIMSIPLGRYLLARFEITGEPIPPELRLRYEALFDRDPRHRGFLVVSGNAFSDYANRGEETSLVFGPDSRIQSFDLRVQSRWRSFTDFVGQGVWHIWIGIDHILFLLALILPSVLVRQDGRWQPAASFRSALWNVIKIVTLFTIAHTITLTAAALEVVTLPARLVESVIALSVVVAALNNVYPILHGHIGWVVFGFGLFHGFGFASVLSHLVKNASNLVVDLLGFNVGVEIGKIAVVAILIPALFLLSRRDFYGRALVPATSVMIGLLALGWFAERAFEMDFLPI
jgi:hypothetical protein